MRAPGHLARRSAVGDYEGEWPSSADAVLRLTLPERHMISAVLAKLKRKLELPIGHGNAARLIAASALDTPFVLLDVGNRDGLHPRWLPLEPTMEVFGFDAIAEMAASNARHHYFKIACWPSIARS
jgi:hypothetical protein